MSTSDRVRAPLEGVCIAEYSKSGRAACRECKEKITLGSLRFGNKVKSRLFDGFETHWLHSECVIANRVKYPINTLTQIVNWRTLKFTDQHDIRTKLGDMSNLRHDEKAVVSQSSSAAAVATTTDITGSNVPGASGVSTASTASEASIKADAMLWKYKELLEKLLSAVQWKSWSKSNGLPEQNFDAQYALCDGLVHGGLLQNCPTCDNNSLVQRMDSVICEGWLSGYVRCDYKSAPTELKRYHMVIPDVVATAVEGASSGVKSHKRKSALPEQTLEERPMKKRKPETEVSKLTARTDGDEGRLIGSTVVPIVGSEILRVDPHFPHRDGTCRVVLEESDSTMVYHSMLNHIDLKTGTNRFYSMQLIQKAHEYYLYTKWGKIGETKFILRKTREERELNAEVPNSQIKTFAADQRNTAIQAFRSKFYDQTGNSWQSYVQGKFVKRPRKYHVVELNRSITTSLTVGGSADLLPANTSQTTVRADPRVARFIDYIFDGKAAIQTMKELGIDPTKMPLGNLSDVAIVSGYRVLKELEQLIQRGANANVILEASTRFYSIVPSVTIAAIEDLKAVQDKCALLDCLAQLKQTHALQQVQLSGDALSSVDRNLASLKCTLTPIEKAGQEWAMIDSYIQLTHGLSHSTYTLKLQYAFAIERDGEAKRFEPWDTTPNHALLFHGSRRGNWAGILSQGLRIAPKEAPCTGYMFGKGVYFANASSKSANYCFTSPTDPHPTGIMMLCQVALGNMYVLQHSKYMDQPPAGYHSTHGSGEYTVSKRDARPLAIDPKCTVPMGPLHPTVQNSSLIYDEFIVYDVSQIKSRYVLMVEFVSR